MNQRLKQAVDARTVLVVLGARSGTSALAGTLGMLGCTLPKHLMGARSSNERGHFEPEDIAVLHDELLAAAGSAWDDWQAFPAAWYDTQACDVHAARLRAAFLDDYGDFTLAVLKEPRMCRLLPLWWRILGEVGCRPAPVFIYRDPIEVARSLAARDGSSMSHGLLYWLRNQLDAELCTRGMRRSFVLFDEVLDDWRKVVCRIEGELDVRVLGQDERRQADVDAFLEPALRHQRRLAPAGEGTDLLTRWAYAAFRQFEVLRSNPVDAAAMQTLDHLRTAFEQHASRAVQPSCTARYLTASDAGSEMPEQHMLVS